MEAPAEHHWRGLNKHGPSRNFSGGFAAYWGKKSLKKNDNPAFRRESRSSQEANGGSPKVD